MNIAEGVVDLGYEDDIKEHGERIQRLEVDMAGVKEKLNSVEGIVTRFETNYYQTSNSIMQQNSSLIQQMTQLITNTSKDNTELEKAKIESENVKSEHKVKTFSDKKDIAIKGLYIVAIVIGGYFGLKGISVSLPIGF